MFSQKHCIENLNYIYFTSLSFVECVLFRYGSPNDEKMCVFTGNQGDPQPPLWNAGRRPLQGERFRSHHRWKYAKICPHVWSTAVLPRPRLVL